MAITKCKECGGEVSTKADACPKCGAKMPARTSGCAWIVAIFIGVPVILYSVTSAMRGNDQPAQVASNGPTAAVKSTPYAGPGRMLWMYRDEGDPMGGQVRSASVQSNNVLSLEFPYQGEQRGTLTIRSHPRHGKDVILQIQRGQFQCTSYSGCDVLVRFDEGPLKKYRAAEPTDNSSTTLFLRGYDGFMASLRKAKKARIEFTLFHQGTRSLEFNVDSLDEGRLSGRKPQPARSPAKQ